MKITAMSRPLRRRSTLLATVLLASGLPVATAVPAGAVQLAPVRFTLPMPTGRQRVGTTSLHLVDTSRPDPWVPDRPVRELMIQLWYPAAAIHGYPPAPWLTPAAARAYEQANGLPVFTWPITAARLDAPVRRHGGRRPVVLYSHGLGGHRGDATALVQDLASHGYVVVTIDHIHDAGVVELPDGHVETGAIPDLAEDNEIELTSRAVRARVADTRFVLDQLAAINHGENPDHEHRSLPCGLRGALDLDRVGMFGHSDGGTTTAHAMHTDFRITTGINLAGTLWTPEAAAGSHRPLLQFGKQDLDPLQATTWAAFRTNHHGPTLQLHLAGSTHASFEDFAVLVRQAAPQLGLTPDQITEVVGTIGGQRAVGVVPAYVDAYFDRYLRHDNSHLLDGPSARYPEIRFVL
ncbi:alpha/beta hydrolase family protein [Actinophytocola xanthii]|nr:hydrolase [Actinophytocola xanthii]